MSDTFTLGAMLEQAAEAHPEAKLHFTDASEMLSIGELERRSAGVAGRLAAAGIRQGARIGVLMHTLPTTPVALFGIMRAGAVPCPMTPPPGLGTARNYVARLRSLLNSARCRALLAPRAFEPRLAAALPGTNIIAIESLEDSNASVPPIRVRSDHLALIQFTSGTVFVPKGVALTHANVLAGIEAIKRGIELDHRDVAGQWLPLFHDMGLIGLLAGIHAGGTQFLSHPRSFIRNPAAWIADFASRRCTIYAGPSFSYAYILDALDPAAAAELDLSAWRVAFNGGESIDPDVVARFIERFRPAGLRPSTLFPVYGLAESTLAATFPRLRRPPETIWVDRDALANQRDVVRVPRDHPKARGIVCVGSPVWGLALRVTDPSGRPVPSARVGEVRLSGLSVMQGYYRDAGETRRSLSKGWLRTGDLGFLLDGKLYVTGRLKHMIVVNGVNHYPEDVEAVASRDADVRLGCYTAIAYQGNGSERVALLVETAIESPERRAALSERLSTRLRLELGLDRSSVLLLRPGSVKRTTSGKIRRNRMRDLLEAGALRDRLWEPPARSPTPPPSHPAPSHADALLERMP